MSIIFQIAVAFSLLLGVVCVLLVGFTYGVRTIQKITNADLKEVERKKKLDKQEMVDSAREFLTKYKDHLD